MFHKLRSVHLGQSGVTRVMYYSCMNKPELFYNMVTDRVRRHTVAGIRISQVDLPEWSHVFKGSVFFETRFCKLCTTMSLLTHETEHHQRQTQSRREFTGRRTFPKDIMCLDYTLLCT